MNIISLSSYENIRKPRMLLLFLIRVGLIASFVVSDHEGLQGCSGYSSYLLSSPGPVDEGGRVCLMVIEPDISPLSLLPPLTSLEDLLDGSGGYSLPYPSATSSSSSSELCVLGLEVYSSESIILACDLEAANSQPWFLSLALLLLLLTEVLAGDGLSGKLWWLFVEDATEFCAGLSLLFAGGLQPYKSEAVFSRVGL